MDTPSPTRGRPIGLGSGLYCDADRGRGLRLILQAEGRAPTVEPAARRATTTNLAVPAAECAAARMQCVGYRVPAYTSSPALCTSSGSTLTATAPYLSYQPSDLSMVDPI